MSCTVNLNDRITGASPAGYYVYLGWAADAKIDPNSEDSDCHDIADLLDAADGNNPYGANSGQDIVQSTHDPIDQDLVNGNNIDFGDVNPGFYGFAYVVGDSNESGNLVAPECGDMTCFEIEVIPGIDMSWTLLDPICEANIASSGPNGNGTFDLPSLITGYVPGGEWFYPLSLGTIDANGVFTLDPTADPGVYSNLSYTISTQTSIHGQDADCDDCTGTVLITFEITTALLAGTAVSLAVCN